MHSNTNEKITPEDELKHLTYIISYDLREPVRMVNSFMGMLDERIAS